MSGDTWRQAAEQTETALHKPQLMSATAIAVAHFTAEALSELRASSSRSRSRPRRASPIFSARRR